MAIVKMNKFTLIAFEENKDRILKKLQAFGEVEFIDLQSKRLEEEQGALNFLQEDVVNSSAKDIEDNLSRLRPAIDFLKNFVPKESALKGLKEGKPTFSYEDLEEYGKEEHWNNIVSFLKEKEERLSVIDISISKLKSELEVLSPWEKLDLPFSSLEGMKDTAYFIGTIPNQLEGKLKEQIGESLSYYNLEIVNRDIRSAYILLLVHKVEAKEGEELLKDYEFSAVKLDYREKTAEVIRSISGELDKLHKEKPFIESELKAFHDQLTTLERAYEYHENKLLRVHQSEKFLKSNRTVVISGWIPCEKAQELHSFIKEVASEDYVLNISEIKEEDMGEAPTKLRNGKMVSAFESITAMYSVPKYNGFDPTPVLTPFYFLFFGMMVADVAYGAITALAALIAIKRFNLDEKTENFARFFMYLGIASALWGFVYGSVFGDVIKIPALINPSQDIFTIVYISIGFGAVQIFTALIIKGYIIARAGSLLHAFFDAGAWIITLAGIGLLIGTGSPLAKYLMFSGMIIIVLTNGREAKTAGGKLAGGLYALYGITGYIGDLISYTRLMALGIAGGSIAGAMNLIISYLPGISFFIIGPIFFILIHIFNLLLSLLGAYVHSCRLQYVEFFGKFYEGGGRPFKPFKMINNYIKIKQ